jgi:disulfide bond formation protein DsbB
MKMLTDRLLPLVANPKIVLASITLISVAALIAAFASEAFLGLEPCIFCIYQRWPYVIAAVLGVIGLFAQKLRRPALALSSLAFAVNSAIATYHTGIEQKWWESGVEGCEVPDFGAEPKSILENIMSAPTGNCAEIPWQDPLLGLSMANYNIALCALLCAVCAVSFMLSKTRQSSTSQP